MNTCFSVALRFVRLVGCGWNEHSWGAKVNNKIKKKIQLKKFKKIVNPCTEWGRLFWDNIKVCLCVWGGVIVARQYLNARQPSSLDEGCWAETALWRSPTFGSQGPTSHSCSRRRNTPGSVWVVSTQGNSRTEDINKQRPTFPSEETAKSVFDPPTTCFTLMAESSRDNAGVFNFDPFMPPSWPLSFNPQTNTLTGESPLLWDLTSPWERAAFCKTRCDCWHSRWTRHNEECSLWNYSRLTCSRGVLPTHNK